ncbi:MAG: CPBP family glutamic-type intramembrane protease [Planctomycetota bacterium]
MGHKKERASFNDGGYFRRTRALSLSLLYILPLLVIYEVGLVILRPDSQNAAGAVVHLLFSYFGDGVLVFNVVLLLSLAIAWARTNKAGGVAPHYLIFVCLEAVFWAACMMIFAVVFVSLARQNLPVVTHLASGASHGGAAGFDPQVYSVATRLAHSCGAGVYEELIFRLFLCTFFVWLFGKLLGKESDGKSDEKPRTPFTAVFMGLMISALLFALAHHIPPQKAIALDPMIFRTVCGFFLGVVFLLRGLAVAVYTHTLYDVYVLLVHPHVVAAAAG